MNDKNEHVNNFLTALFSNPESSSKENEKWRNLKEKLKEFRFTGWHEQHLKN